MVRWRGGRSRTHILQRPEVLRRVVGGDWAAVDGQNLLTNADTTQLSLRGGVANDNRMLAAKLHPIVVV